MKAPLCRLCKTRHWSTEPHDLGADAPSYAGEVYGTPVHAADVEYVGIVLGKDALIVVDVVNKAVTKLGDSVTKVQPVTKGRPKRYESPAEKQAAYRARRKA